MSAAHVHEHTFVQRSADLLLAQGSARHYAPHIHDAFSVVVVTGGTASVQCRRWRGTVHTGDIFFFNPLEAHGGGSPGLAIDYRAIYASPAFVADTLTAAQREAGAVRLRTTVLRKGDATEDFIAALGCARSTAGLETALSRLFGACTFEAAALAPMGNAAVQAACELIAQNFMRVVRTEDLARRVGLHPSHFVRSFHAAVGMPPQTFLRQIRVGRAQELICAGEDLSQVALAAGFCDQAHLSREFKKVYGVSPGRVARDLKVRPAQRPPPPRL